MRAVSQGDCGRAENAGVEVRDRHPACPYCQGRSSFLTGSTDYNRGTTEREFFYFECAVCGLVFMDPIPENMRPYYEGGYEPIPENLAALRAIAAKERYRVEPILRYKRSGKLLEIGPWRGVFCSNAKDAGFEVSAIEMDERCVRFLNETVGVRAIQSVNPAETLNGMDERFDAIALWHSLEHLPEPWKVIEAASRRLNPGGVLLVSIPNIKSLEFSLLGARWRHLDAPRHLFFYPVESLVSLCEANGFETVEMTTEDGVSGVLARDTWHHWGVRQTRMPLLARNLMRAGLVLSRLMKVGRVNAGSGLTGVFRLRGTSQRIP